MMPQSRFFLFASAISSLLIGLYLEGRLELNVYLLVTLFLGVTKETWLQIKTGRPC